MLKLVLFILFTLLVFFAHTQKEPLSNQHFDEWKTIKSATLSADGNWLSYEVIPYRGDGHTVVVDLKTNEVDTIPRAYAFKFGYKNAYFAARIKAPFDTLRKLELDKVKKDKFPKDTLWLYNTVRDTLILIPNLMDVKISEKSTWLLHRIDTNELPQTQPVKKKRKKKKSKKGAEEDTYTSDGKLLTVWNPIDDLKRQYIDVTTYNISPSGNFYAFITHQKRDKDEVYNLDVRHFSDHALQQYFSAFTSIGNIAWHEEDQKFAFLASRDTVKKNKHFDLYLVDLFDDSSVVRIDSLFTGMPVNHGVSEYGDLRFAKDGNRLYFGTSKLPGREEKDTLTENEKFKVDIWSWKDGELQPQQLKNAKKKQQESVLSFYDWENGRFKILENDSIKVNFGSDEQTKRFLASSDKPYVREAGWSFPWKRDYYLVDIDQDEPELLLEGFAERVHFSPDGNQIVYFNPQKKEYYLKDLDADKTHCLTCGFVANWIDDNNGQPHEETAINRVYWESGGTHVWLQAEDDLYRVRKNGLSFRCMTDDAGKAFKQNYSVYKWDKDSLFFHPERVWIKAQDSHSKKETVYTLNSNWELTKRFEADANLNGFVKADSTDRIVFRKSTVNEYPNLWITDVHFNEPTQQTDANPQQSDYNWANVELVEWKTPMGKELQGLLYTPEDLDTNKSYPMLVYFYELNSDNLHRHWTPRPTASIIFPTEYASAGYVVFIPDVRYEPGKPAQSAYDCIISGTEHILKNYSFVDSTRMGLQGQSWGGYQTAQLITMTKRFRAAMAGAPVANMFSAYGGIRWGSGFSRMFQYEHTQSRIGATIWEKPELYIENSPLFGLPKVESPLLIMHNDEDGAVPWYQGIELFMGLRRLNKPVWLLNYNGDDHNLMKEGNRRDLSIRMKQFFDHYLMNAPAPKWITEGIPAVDKGVDFGY